MIKRLTLTALLLMMLVTPALAEKTTITVDPGYAHRFPVNLEKGNTLNIYFNVTGGGNGEINFYIEPPQGDDNHFLFNVTNRVLHVKANSSGTHNLVFSNMVDVDAGRSVSLGYSVESGSSQGIPGFPLEGTLVAVALCSAVFLLFGKRGRSAARILGI